jgi:hypothetical protein
VNTDIIIGFASAALALISAIASGLLAGRANRQAHDLDRRRRQDSQVEEAERVLRQYRDPLLDAAQTLQSRVFNIVRQNYFARYLHCGDPDEERYARNYTLFALGEYLCWAEIVRRELRFLDLGNVAHNRQLLAHLTKVQVTLQSDRVDSPFRIFRGRQRALAELMMTPTGASDGPRSECVGYAAFSQRLHSDEEFSSWFAPLNDDIDAVAAAPQEDNVRLIHLQRDLVDLIDFLDPDSVRIPLDYRRSLDPPPEQPEDSTSQPYLIPPMGAPAVQPVAQASVVRPRRGGFGRGRKDGVD